MIQIRKYYEENKENLKNGKVTFRQNIEVRKDKEDTWLNIIKTKAAFVKNQMNLSSARLQCSAASAHLMESEE